MKNIYDFLSWKSFSLYLSLNTKLVLEWFRLDILSSCFKIMKVWLSIWKMMEWNQLPTEIQNRLYHLKGMDCVLISPYFCSGEITPVIHCCLLSSVLQQEIVFISYVHHHHSSYSWKVELFGICRIQTYGCPIKKIAWF